MTYGHVLAVLTTVPALLAVAGLAIGGSGPLSPGTAYSLTHGELGNGPLYPAAGSYRGAGMGVTPSTRCAPGS